MTFDAGPSQMDWPGMGGGAVTPSDSADLEKFTRGIIVGVAGDVKVTFMNGSSATLPALAAGVVHPIAARRIWLTDTTATGIVAIY